MGTTKAAGEVWGAKDRPQSAHPADDLGQHMQCECSLLGHLAARQVKQLLEGVPCSLGQGQEVRSQDVG